MSGDDFELELDYDCSSLTLEQSILQVFNILKSVKLPNIEKQQINSLQSHISSLLIQQNDVASFNKRLSKSNRKAISLRRDWQSTAQKQPDEYDEEEVIEESVAADDGEVSPFALGKVTASKGKTTAAKDITSQVMTRS